MIAVSKKRREDKDSSGKHKIKAVHFNYFFFVSIALFAVKNLPGQRGGVY